MTIRLRTFDKIIRAAEIYDSLNDIQKAMILPEVNRIVSIQEQINEDAKKLGACEICAECEGTCCSNGIEYGIQVSEFLYAMFYISQEQREKIYAVIQSPTRGIYCSLIGEDGCVLPSAARPINCKSYHCFMIPGSTSIRQEYARILNAADVKYQYTLGLMEIEL